ncbi:hypothetical protein GTY54_19085 [Streptomyces sp. SID625]|nr:hypothetical protein [Streptomyces sp. SID625]
MTSVGSSVSSPANRVSAARQARSRTSGGRSCSSSRTPGAAAASGSEQVFSSTSSYRLRTDSTSTRTARASGSSGAGCSSAVRAERRSPAQSRPVFEERSAAGRRSRLSGWNASSSRAYEPGALPTSSTSRLTEPTAG